MRNRLLRGVVALGIAGATLAVVGCGGERQSEAVPAEVIAGTELASLRIEGMT